MPIGDHIRDLRWDRRLKQGELAHRAGIAQNTLSQIELGKTTPSVPTLEKIARGLNVDLSELLIEEAAVPLAEAPRGAGQSLLERARDAARQDEKKQGQAVNRLFASEGTLPATNMTKFQEDTFRAELRSRGFPDEYFESFIWPLVTTVNQQEQEISHLREEISRLRKLEAPAQVPGQTEPGEHENAEQHIARLEGANARMGEENARLRQDIAELRAEAEREGAHR